ncbi:MAG: hypothetical protein O2971_07555 [Proteobacteria bacterium]|nr:hypothetical protein [Pseudomonadota bacterium]
MNSIDEKIRKALSDEDKRLIEEIDEQPGLFELMSMTYKGKQAWMTFYMYALGLVTFLAGLYFLSLYFDATDIKSSLTWALAIIVCLFVIMLVKIISWQQMLKMEILREIKRLEMRVMVGNHSDK